MKGLYNRYRRVAYLYGGKVNEGEESEEIWLTGFIYIHKTERFNLLKLL
jgi:hypothetical protein